MRTEKVLDNPLTLFKVYTADHPQRAFIKSARCAYADIMDAKEELQRAFPGAHVFLAHIVHGSTKSEQIGEYELVWTQTATHHASITNTPTYWVECGDFQEMMPARELSDLRDHLRSGLSPFQFEYVPIKSDNLNAN